MVEMARFGWPGFLIICSVLVKIEQILCTKTSCNGTYANLEGCWDWHHLLPTTCDRISLVKCSEIEEYNLRDCDADLKQKAAHTTKMYSTAMNITCNDKDLYSVFQREEACWRDARSCAVPIIRLPQKPTADECLYMISQASDCKSHEHNEARTPSCSAVLEKFVDTFLRESVCGAPNIIVNISEFIISVTIAIFVSNM